MRRLLPMRREEDPSDSQMNEPGRDGKLVCKPPVRQRSLPATIAPTALRSPSRLPRPGPGDT